MKKMFMLALLVVVTSGIQADSSTVLGFEGAIVASSGVQWPKGWIDTSTKFKNKEIQIVGESGCNDKLALKIKSPSHLVKSFKKDGNLNVSSSDIVIVLMKVKGSGHIESQLLINNTDGKRIGRVDSWKKLDTAGKWQEIELEFDLSKKEKCGAIELVVLCCRNGKFLVDDMKLNIEKDNQFYKKELTMVRQEPNTISVKDLHFLQGESPCQVRHSKPTCIECCVTLGGIEMTDVLLIESIKQTFDFQPNDSYEAYTENCIDRKGNRTSLKQFSLVTSIKAVGQGVILSETNTKEPFCKVLEELPGSKSVVCVERNVGNLGDPFGSCLARKELPTTRRHSGYLRGVRSFHSTLRRESRPRGEGNDGITQPAQEICSRHGELI